MEREAANLPGEPFFAQTKALEWLKREMSWTFADEIQLLVKADQRHFGTVRSDELCGGRKKHLHQAHDTDTQIISNS